LGECALFSPGGHRRDCRRGGIFRGCGLRFHLFSRPVYLAVHRVYRGHIPLAGQDLRKRRPQTLALGAAGGDGRGHLFLYALDGNHPECHHAAQYLGLAAERHPDGARDGRPGDEPFELPHLPRAVPADGQRHPPAGPGGHPAYRGRGGAVRAGLRQAGLLGLQKRLRGDVSYHPGDCGGLYRRHHPSGRARLDHPGVRRAVRLWRGGLIPAGETGRKTPPRVAVLIIACR